MADDSRRSPLSRAIPKSREVFRVRDDAFTGTSPFVAARGPERNTNFGGGLNGTLVKDKSSLGLFVFGTNSYDTPNLNAVLPTGTLAESLKLKTPRENLFVNGQLDYALTLDQTLRFGYNLSSFTNENLADSQSIMDQALKDGLIKSAHKVTDFVVRA